MPFDRCFCDRVLELASRLQLPPLGHGTEVSEQTNAVEIAPNLQVQLAPTSQLVDE